MAGWKATQARRGDGWLALALVICLVALPAMAQDVEERPDVRVIIDVSGSMKANDPEQLSTSALELLVSLLPWGVSAGVWTFGERVANPLSLARVDADWRDRALALSPALGEYQQYTDIESALQEAASARANGWRHLVLLTDGMIDLPPSRGEKPGIDRASRRRLVEEIAPRFANQGVVVHAVAFSDQADLALVERIAQSTGGLSSLVETPESLLGAFLDIFERIFPADQVPMTEGRFVIDPGVESFSALLFHEPDGEPLTLTAPDGSIYSAEQRPDDIHWQVESHFDLIRVPDPQPGEWRLEGEAGGESRISVISPQRLHTNELPTTLYLGFEVPVEAWIEQDGEPLSEARDDIRVSVALQGPDGDIKSAIDLQPQGSRFTGVLPPPALTGNSRLVIRAEGEDFHRQRIQAVNVLPAIGMTHQPGADRVVLVAEHPRLDRDNTELTGELQGETLQANAVGDSRWHLPLPKIEESLRLPLRITARITLDGVTREIRLPRLLLNPDASTALDLADLAGPTLSAERLESPVEAEGTSGAADGAADRFVELVNELPRLAMVLWQEGWPALTRAVGQHGRDPRLWLGMFLAAILLMATLLLHRWRQRRRRRHRRRRRRTRSTSHREEPYV